MSAGVFHLDVAPETYCSRLGRGGLAQGGLWCILTHYIHQIIGRFQDGRTELVVETELDRHGIGGLGNSSGGGRSCGFDQDNSSCQMFFVCQADMDCHPSLTSELFQCLPV